METLAIRHDYISGMKTMLEIRNLGISDDCFKMISHKDVFLILVSEDVLDYLKKNVSRTVYK